ncbi:hypothetical protein C9J85_16050 [Haloferax sp. wsp5]|nr:hypothetical protein C9J85_16050 [Haloferax sp. wsp5]
MRAGTPAVVPADGHRSSPAAVQSGPARRPSGSKLPMIESPEDETAQDETDAPNATEPSVDPVVTSESATPR